MYGTSKIKATVITGFLGSGKTTFINQLLRQHPETQFALVENEFGDVAIDTKLIKGVDASQMFELKQGCICCTITDEFELVLLELAQRFPHVQHLLIETTGVADPAAVVRPFFEKELKDIYQYNGTTCLVDALHFWDSPEKELTLKQLVVADMTVVSKAEGLSESEKTEFKSYLQMLNPLSEIIFSGEDDQTLVSLESILRKKKSEFDFVSISVTQTKLSAKTWLSDEPLYKSEFVRRLEYFLDVYKNKIYRAKGILCFENELYEFVLQAVGGSFELTEGDDLLYDKSSKIVFIGKLDDVDFDVF